MRQTDLAALLLSAALLGTAGLPGCAKSTAAAQPAAHTAGQTAGTPQTEPVEASTLEAVDGEERPRVHLSPQAARRLDIATTPVLAAAHGARQISATALLYDEQGGTWVYVLEAPLRYRRESVTVKTEGVQADSGAALLLSDGPAVGAAVVTRGVAELYGTEFGVH